MTAPYASQQERSLALPQMVGWSTAFKESLRVIRKISETDAPVLLDGETGTGKALAARAIHYLGKRQGMPFVPLNCRALPGIRPGEEGKPEADGTDPFTDALEEARGGTLLLDDVDALPIRSQIALLRFLQNRQEHAFGLTTTAAADVRLIATTNSDILQRVAAGHFRPDLLFRLKILSLTLPPLRLRSGDARLLADHFIRQFSARYQKPARPLHPDTESWMDQYEWPGNVRELRNLLHQAFLLDDSPYIRLPSPVRSTQDNSSVDGASFADCEFNLRTAKARVIADFERQFLRSLLSQTGGNVTLAAKLAGKERRAFGKLLKKYGIEKTIFQHLP